MQRRHFAVVGLVALGLVVPIFGAELVRFGKEPLGPWDPAVLVVECVTLVALIGLFSTASRLVVRCTLGIGLAAAIRFVALTGVPVFSDRGLPGELESHLAAELGTTSLGIPFDALFLVIGLLSAGVGLFGALEDERTRTITLPRALLLAIVTAPVLLGISVVLGYATGSPWPFLP